jgi:hypothetical protein
MLLSAVSVLVVAQRSSEVPEGLMNNPVYKVYKIQHTSNLKGTKPLLESYTDTKCTFRTTLKIICHFPAVYSVVIKEW